MMMRIFLYILLLSISAPGMAQGRPMAHISGLVGVKYIDKDVAGARVSLYRRNYSKDAAGNYTLHAAKSSQLLNTVSAGPVGSFHFYIELQDTLDFYMVEVTAPGFEGMREMIIPLRDEDMKRIFFVMHPTAQDAATERLLAADEETELRREDAKRRADYPAIAAEISRLHTPALMRDARVQACSYTVPANIWVTNLANGYNNTSCTNSNALFTGFMNFDEYVAGVVGGEMGTGTAFSLEAKKAQVVAARTYSLWRTTPAAQGGGGYTSGNCGQSYTSQTCTTCASAATATTGQVLTYNNVIIDALYSARCNGNFTQNSNQGTFNPAANCNLTGNLLPYLLSQPCSGHTSCNSVSGELPCCNVTISTAGTPGYLYGHGVGLCQRGAQGFAALGNSHDQILNKFYTGVCIANLAASCIVPAAPVPTYGADLCPGATASATNPPGTTLTWNPVANAAGYKVYLSKYPYGSANLLTGYDPFPCGSFSSLSISPALQPGMLYRWNMYATGDCSNAACEGPMSATKYFHVPPNIVASGSTNLCGGQTVTLSVSPIPAPGAGGSVAYKWFNGVNQISGASTSSYTTALGGSYTVQLVYSGSSACATATTSPGNAIVVSVCTALPVVESLEYLQVLPNPSHGKFLVKMKLRSQQVTGFSIYNAQGQLFYQSRPEKMVGPILKTIDAGAAQPGIYFLEITIGNRVVRQKLSFVN
jgi:hypothetical protein